jgi:hypothetical protein
MMTKIEFWRKVKENCENGNWGCMDVRCKNCPIIEDSDICKIAKNSCETEQALALAEAYIKRHEQKSKKKDHIEDKPEKVESTAVSYEPCVSCRNNHGLCSTKERTANVKNCVSYEPIDIEKNYFKKKVEEPKPVQEPTPLDIAKMIRDNGYSCLGLIKNCPPCPLWGKGGCGTSDKIVEEKHIKRKKLIDDYISANEPTVKENLSVPCKPLASGMCSNPFDHCEEDCPANSEYPQPIKLPDFVYSASKSGVEFIDTKNRTFNTNDKGELLINDKPCFTTPEEALQVAKKLWQGEGK